MVVEFGHMDGSSVLTPRGRLNLNTVDEFRATVSQALGQGHRRLLIDLRSAESVDSTGLGALVWAATNARRLGGDLHLANANESVRLLLERTHVGNVLPLYEGEGDWSEA